MAKELLPIKIETLPNGYGLKVDGNDYMAFNDRELLEMMFVHVGLEKRNYMDKDTIHDLMTACATWPKEGDAIKAASQQEAVIEAMKQSHQSDMSTIYDLRERLAKVSEELANAKAQLKAIGAELKPTTRKKRGPNPNVIHRADVEDKPAKRTREAAIAKIREPKVKKPNNKGGRAKADEAVKAELERQLKEKGVLK